MHDNTSPIVVRDERQRQSLARVIARLYRAADAPLRERILISLLQPLGTLSVAAVAAGAFGEFIHRRGSIRDVRDFSRAQVRELVRFTCEVNPDALRRVAELLSRQAAGMAAFSAAALRLVERQLRIDAGPQPA